MSFPLFYKVKIPHGHFSAYVDVEYEVMFCGAYKDRCVSRQRRSFSGRFTFDRKTKKALGKQFNLGPLTGFKLIGNAFWTEVAGDGRIYSFVGTGKPYFPFQNITKVPH